MYTPPPSSVATVTLKENEFGKLVPNGIHMPPCLEPGCNNISTCAISVQVDKNEFEDQPFCDTHAEAKLAADHVCDSPNCFSCGRPE